ncbi:hypothetical protein ENSA7_40520 [Enhygromyxa salina]|uniref:Uncharacterized protein n=1 Tax=Enhygromyxa salina TaxID=215803 RepID=A0A2S9YM79_9BACT|nr:hypothetical protein ENSA7_40520 [Enhygromyxa salina]
MKNLDAADPADYWDQRFRLVEEPAGLRVISAGRDGEFGTEDDLLSDAVVEAKFCQREEPG